MKEYCLCERKQKLEQLAYEEYASEFEKVVKRVFDKTNSGKIRWEKWDKERFETNLIRHYKKCWKIDINVDQIYNQVLSEYVRVYVQQDFMKELYGFTYSSGKGDFKDYGTVLFFGIPDYHGNYDFVEFLSYWVFSVLKPKYRKWVKSKKINKEEISQRWSPLYDAIKYFDNDVSKSEIKKVLVDILGLYGIKFNRITDYQIFF